MTLRANGILLLLSLGFLLALPVAASAPELPIDPDQNPGGSEDPAPTVDPSRVAREVEDRLRDDYADGGGGGSKVPAPPGSGNDWGEIGSGVGEVLTENWVLTLTVTGGLVSASVAGWFLASRYIDPRIALRNPQRSMLYGFVKGNPGVHLKQLSSEFRMKTSTVLWHVRKLEAADLIRSKKANGYRVFYPVSGGLEARRLSEAVTALSNGNARNVFGFIIDNPGAPMRALLERLIINSGTVRWHLKKLRQAGLLAELEESPEGIFQPTELGLKAWNQVQGSAQPVTVPVVSVGTDSTTHTEEVEVASP